MAERIYNRSKTGSLDPLNEEPFVTENELQDLLAEHPELLDGEQVRPGDPRRWLLIKREKGIAESSDTGSRWALDHLIVDQDAVPTLVEVKRGSNPEIRRTIVGQMLEYAANAARTWTGDELRQTFEATAASDKLDPDEELGRLLQVDDEPDADGFWEKVATNLTATRLRLLFVADEIPDTLERIVMFLNAQMPNIEVLAVEIKQFRGESTQTLVPRVLGRVSNVPTRSSSGSRQRLTREAFLDDFTAEEERNAAQRLLDVVQDSGAALKWGPSGVSVRMRCSLRKQRVSVAWFYPPSTTKGWQKTRDFTFGAAILDEDLEEELRTALEQWANLFRDDKFTTDASSKGVDARSVNYLDAVQHIDLLSGRLADILTKLKSL